MPLYLRNMPRRPMGGTEGTNVPGAVYTWAQYEGSGQLHKSS